MVIVGAALAGARTAQALRRYGYLGAITVIGAEHHQPYDRPPLSKGFLAGDVHAAGLAVCDDPELDDLDVDLVLGHRATRLELRSRRVCLADGTRVPFDRLVVATGAEPVMPTMFPAQAWAESACCHSNLWSNACWKTTPKNWL